MRRLLVTGISVLSIFFQQHAYEIPEYAQPIISFYGYANLESSYDTRQINESREGNGASWPLRERPDALGRDINDQGQTTITPINTCIGLEARGPDVCDIENYAIIESDFRGINDDAISLLRLRYGYGYFNFGHTSILTGKYNHPLWVADVAPNMVTYLAGAPPDTQVRAPQIRMTHYFAQDNRHELFWAILSESEGSLSSGPQGRTSDYIRNAEVPNLHVQYRHLIGPHVIGIGIDYKRLVPRLVSDANFIDRDADVQSAIFTAYAGFNFEEWAFRTKVILSWNGEDQSLLNGYAVATQDPVTNQRTYANLRGISYWWDADFFINYCVQPGVFLGVFKSRGADELLFIDPSTNEPIIFGGQPDIDYLLKFAPRVWYFNGPVGLGWEIELSRATFGSLDAYARVVDATPVNNVRFTFTTYYYF
jgi:hypothetical protein